MKITAKYLTKVYKNGTYALDDFSVCIDSGEVVSVLGESGCGKTTLLRVLSGLEKPTAGELYFDDVLYRDVPLKNRDTAVVFQEYVLYPNMTVWENVAMALQRYDLPREEEDRRVYKVLNDFGMLKFRNQLPRVLSGGQQQRVALARAVVRKPSLLLFDEPLSNIAEEQRHEYISLLKEIKQSLPDTTFIYVTHNPREAMAVGNKLLIMHNGRVLQYGDKSRVWCNPYNAEILRTICVNYQEVEGTLEKGVFTGKNGETYQFDTQQSSTDALVIFNPYDSNKPYLFDGHGNALCGERQIRYFDGSFDGKVLRFAGIEYAVDDNFKLRFVGELGDVKVGIENIKLKSHEVYGDLKIPVEQTDGNSQGGALYVNPDDINLYDDKGFRTLAHYRVYKSSCDAKYIGGKLRLPCGVIACQSPYSGAVNVTFADKTYVTLTKRGGIKAICLAEDNLGDVKLVNCVVKGFNHYVTFYAKPNEKFFGVKRLRLNVDPRGIVLSKPF